jgi:hypothetical protein
VPLATLSYGYKKPSNPTYGDLFFPAMEANIQQLNDHTHNGVNSARIAATTQTILAASWVADGAYGTYYQDVTVPAGISYDTIRIEVRRSGAIIYPTITRTSSTVFRIYTNDNTVDNVISYV